MAEHPKGAPMTLDVTFIRPTENEHISAVSITTWNGRPQLVFVRDALLHPRCEPGLGHRNGTPGRLTTQPFKPYTTIEEVAALLPRTPENAHIIDRFGRRTIVEAIYAGRMLPALDAPMNAGIILDADTVLWSMRSAMMTAGWRRETRRRRQIINALGCTDEEAATLAFKVASRYNTSEPPPQIQPETLVGSNNEPLPA